MSAVVSPILYYLFSKAALKSSCDNNSNKSVYDFYFNNFKQVNEWYIGLIRFFLLSADCCNLEHKFQTCFEASRTNIFKLHLNPFSTAYTV